MLCCVSSRCGVSRGVGSKNEAYLRDGSYLRDPSGFQKIASPGEKTQGFSISGNEARTPLWMHSLSAEHKLNDKIVTKE